MRKNRWHLLGAWVASIAILMATWAPAVSQVLAQRLAAQSDALFTQDICSVDGVSVALGGAGHGLHADAPSGAPSDGKPVHGANHLEHCPFCSKHGGMAGVPPTVLSVVALTLPALLPTLYTQSAHTLFAWAPAQARAPPVIA